MCLYVVKSHIQDPIHEMECIKQLEYEPRVGWVTPYQRSLLEPGTGWFMPSIPSDSHTWTIYGGFIHAYTTDAGFDNSYIDRYRTLRDTLPTQRKSNRTYTFKAFARDVVAIGRNYDIACKAIYIPAFDITGAHRNAILTYK